MRVNTQFPVAIHLLALLAFFGNKYVTSEVAAKSVGTNPVVIRRVVSRLKKAGFVKAQAGVKGILLCKKPQDVTLLDVYNAMRSPENVVFDLHPHPNPACPIGAHIESAMNGPLAHAQQAMEKELGYYTLADIVKVLSEKSGLKIE